MQKIFFLLFLPLISASVNLAAQKPASAGQQQLMMEKITQASQNMRSLTCDFSQTKELSVLNDKMESSGRMYYRNDNRLCWEYLSPYSCLFILNGNKLLVQSEKSRNVTDIKSSKLFREIIKIMMCGINGSGLADRNFKAGYFWGEKVWEVVLLPQQKEIRKMFSEIKLLFNTKDYSVDCVEMKEQGGDKTVIRLTNKQFNAKIEDRIFHID